MKDANDENFGSINGFSSQWVISIQLSPRIKILSINNECCNQMKLEYFEIQMLYAHAVCSA